jgi:hypothetical protein
VSLSRRESRSCFERHDQRRAAEGVPDIRIAAEERWVMSRELRGLVVRFRV